MEKQATVWDVERESIDRGYGHLPENRMDEWVRHQATLSENYSKGLVGSSSSTEEGQRRKENMMNRVKQALTFRSNLSQSEIDSRLAEIDKHLEDPGLLENFEYFNIPDSDYMLQFYLAVWDRRIAEVMDFLHNYGKDLKGVPQRIPENDTWCQMSYFEGMNIDKRKQAQHIVEFMKAHHITKATSFGGGHVPERFYKLPEDLFITVFDNGPACSVEELFPDAEQRKMVNYIHEPLSMVPKHQDLFGSQELVWMHGVSMYLDEAAYQVTSAILCAEALLQAGGFMCYDYLINNESICRAISTQGWPNDPTHPMTMFERPDLAIQQGCKTIETVNARLGGKSFMDIVDINVNFAEPWGAMSVYFTLQKHA